MSLDVVKGSTDVTQYVVIQDSITGVIETGFDVTTLKFQYTRNGEAPSVAQSVSLLGGTAIAHADNKAIEIDATNSKGQCRVDFPDAAFITGVDSVILSVVGAGFYIAPKEIQLINTPVIPDTAGIAAALHTITDGLVNGIDDPSAATIATAVMASSIDTGLDMTKALKVILALNTAKKVVKSGNIYTYFNQDGDLLVTITFGAETTTAVIV